MIVAKGRSSKVLNSSTYKRNLFFDPQEYLRDIAAPRILGTKIVQEV